MTYEIISPFLKGLHLTLCSHLPSRDDEGWKLSESGYLEYLQAKMDQGSLSQDEMNQLLESPPCKDTPTPEIVIPVKRVRDDFKFLADLFASDKPLEITARSRKIVHLLYGFADASGTGFGSSVVSNKGIRIRVGVWGRDEDEEETSNWKEFTNSVEA